MPLGNNLGRLQTAWVTIQHCNAYVPVARSSSTACRLLIITKWCNVVQYTNDGPPSLVFPKWMPSITGAYGVPQSESAAHGHTRDGSMVNAASQPNSCLAARRPQPTLTILCMIMVAVMSTVVPADLTMSCSHQPTDAIGHLWEILTSRIGIHMNVEVGFYAPRDNSFAPNGA